jgi:hypothetical protein
VAEAAGDVPSPPELLAHAAKTNPAATVDLTFVFTDVPLSCGVSVPVGALAGNAQISGSTTQI